MTTDIQMIGTQAIRMSTASNGKFLRANWIGVKISFATRLMPNDNATHHGNFLELARELFDYDRDITPQLRLEDARIELRTELAKLRGIK